MFCHYYVFPFFESIGIGYLGTILDFADGLTMFIHMTCFFKDPGILIKAEKPDLEMNEIAEDNHLTTEGAINTLSNLKETEKADLYSSNHSKGVPSIYTERYCKTCNIVRPKLASHCKICNNCVLNFDQ